MSEPTIQDLLNRVEAAEKRAADAEVRAAGHDTVSQVEARLESQENLNRRYAANRASNLDVMRNGMPESRFRALARGETGSSTPADASARIVQCENENKALVTRLANLEAIVLERETTPKAPTPGRDARR